MAPTASRIAIDRMEMLAERASGCRTHTLPEIAPDREAVLLTDQHTSSRCCRSNQAELSQGSRLAREELSTVLERRIAYERRRPRRAAPTYVG
ncbi:MAG: hypothetical protein U5K37_02465 [Natrialbaceae archaeon]|nr:hypothetical protein [Natrialbaceae archaeon]